MLFSLSRPLTPGWLALGRSTLYRESQTRGDAGLLKPLQTKEDFKAAFRPHGLAGGHA
jgi:hypothetical protein